MSDVWSLCCSDISAVSAIIHVLLSSGVRYDYQCKRMQEDARYDTVFAKDPTPVKSFQIV